MFERPDLRERFLANSRLNRSRRIDLRRYRWKFFTSLIKLLLNFTRENFCLKPFDTKRQKIYIQKRIWNESRLSLIFLLGSVFENDIPKAAEKIHEDRFDYEHFETLITNLNILIKILTNFCLIYLNSAKTSANSTQRRGRSNRNAPARYQGGMMRQ